MNREADPQTQAQLTTEQDDTAQGGWLRRWSQRKHQGGESAEDPQQSAATQAPTLPASTGPVQDVPADEAEEAALPPIESLDEHSDYRGFMSDKVSEELRLLALRKLFSLPQFNLRDGLNDYDEDFTSFKPLGDIVPHDMARSIERALQQIGDPGVRDAPATTAAVPAAQQMPPVTEAQAAPVEGDTGQDDAGSDDPLAQA